MTDAGEFERLATAVLRRAEPAYAALVHSGVNAQGRPVPSPVDGFSLGGQPTPIFTAHTTMALSALRGKWLNSTQGDIAKASQAMRRVGASSAQLVLTLNRDPPLNLVADTEAACAAAGLSLDLWSQSRIADFLDDDAEGQWIRHRFFGSSETRLSFSGLRDIGEAGPADLALFDAEAALVPRRVATELAERLRNGQRLILLNATSGLGKTVIAAQIWREMVASGAGAVHITHQDIEASVTLSEALSRALRRRSPSLTPICGQAAIDLAVSHDVFVLAEDINRAERPIAALQKVILWSTQVTAPGLTLLCPVWPRAIAALSDQEGKAVGGAVAWLDLPAHDEAVAIAKAQAAAQGRCPPTNTLDAIVERLGRDPLLLSLHDYGDAMADGVRAYIAREVSRVARASGQPGADLLDALDALARGMLKARILEPKWRDVRAWIEREDAVYLQRLLDAGSLLRLGGEAADERIVFRHDRVRDQIRAAGLRSLLHSGDEEEVLGEPHYGELWGLVLSDPEVPDDWVDYARNLNPLGLFLGLAIATAGTPRRAALAAAAAEWLRKADAQSERHSHLRWAAQFALTEIEGADVVELLKHFAETTWMTREAAAWNGDMEAALRIAMSWDAYQVRGREKRLFEQIRLRHAERARSFVEAGLRDAANVDRWPAFLGMAGRLQDPALEQVLLDVWANGSREPEFINAMLWAMTLCAPDQIEPILDAWSELDEEPLENGRTPRGRVGYGLRSGFWAMASLTACGVFLRRAKDLNSPLAWYLGNLLEGWDYPDAQEAYVRLLAHRLKSRANGGGGLVGSNLGEMWGEERPRGGRRMSETSLERVRSLWSDPAEDIDVQTVALRLWGYAARPRHLSSVHHLLDPLGPLGPDTVHALIQLEAADAPAALDAQIEADPSRTYLWQWVRGRWRNAYLPYLVKTLERRRAFIAANGDTWFSGDIALPDVMQWLDDQTRERLLSEHWDHVGENNQWIQLALWTATPVTLELARQSLTAGAPSEILKYLNHDYGLYSGSAPPTTDLRRLRALEPWFDYLNEQVFSSLEEHCNRVGWREWRRAHVDGRLKADKRASWRSPTTRREAFEEFANEDQRKRHVHFTLKHMMEMEGSLQPILDELEAWLTERKDLVALRVVCECLVDAATRRDLPRLEAWRGVIPQGDEIIDDAIFAVKRRSLL
jgi:hypothetical protein